MDEYIEHLERRLEELRQLWSNTGAAEHYWRFLEAQRLREHLVNEQIKSSQAAGCARAGAPVPMLVVTAALWATGDLDGHEESS